MSETCSPIAKIYTKVSTTSREGRRQPEFYQAEPIIVNPHHTRSVRVVAISDTHSKLNANLPAGDILIHSGDVCIHENMEEFEQFARIFSSLPFKHKIYVAGNHDLGAYQAPREVVDALLPGVHYLQDGGCEIEGIKFWGMPWGPNGPAFKFDHESDRMQYHCNWIPSDTQYLITHMPPFNVLDLAWEEHIGSTDTCPHCFAKHPHYQHWGSLMLRNRVRQIQPLVHQFGHVHDRRTTVAYLAGCKTRFVNAALDLDWRPTVFDLLL